MVPGDTEDRTTVPYMPSALAARATRRVAQATVLAAVVGGTVAFTAYDTTVDLTVDGQTSQVRAFARSVDDVLAAQGIEVGAQDVVSPALDAPVEEGDEIVVRYGRELTVDVDGDEASYWTTATTVDEALRDLDIRAEGAVLSASRSARLPRSGLEVDITTPKPITVDVDGKVRPTETVAKTVGEALSQMGLQARPQDRVSVPLEAPTSAGLAVTITRIDTARVDEEQAIAAPVEERRTGALFSDERRTEVAGSTGAKVVTFEEVRENGNVVKRTPVGEKVVREPQTKVVLVGTKQRPAPARASRSAAASSGGSGVWDRLAACESGGNWAINTGNGYYGGLQFNAQTWRAYGGTGLPHQNSKAEQIAVASRLRDARGGYGAWPSCSRKLGLR
jgi:resuscitation-promoting factor RpfB